MPTLNTYEWTWIINSVIMFALKDDVPSRYTDPGHGVRHSRARLDYDMPGGASQYGDAYSDRSVSSKLFRSIYLATISHQCLVT